MTRRRGEGVLHIALSKRYGGADVRVSQLASALSGRMPCTVVCVHGSGLHERLAAARVNHVPLRTGRADPRTGHAVATLLRSGRFSVVDAHNPQSQWWGLLAARVTGTPGLVMTAHSQYRFEHGEGSLRGHGYEGVLRVSRRAGSAFIAISDATAGYLRQIGVPAERIAVIPNAIADRPPADPDRSARPADWPDEALVLGTVGRLEPVKGLPDLLQALAAVRDEGHDVRLLMVGEGRSRDDLEARVRAMGLQSAVAFVGFRRDVERLLPLMDVFCQPSHSEGLPFALLEAAVAARPVLVTDVGEVATVVPPGAGVVVPPQQPAALTDALRRLIADPPARAAMGTTLRESVLRRFSLDSLAEHTMAVYRGAASGA